MADPIAITGIACRYPKGIDSPEALWRMVDDEVCVIDRLPDERGWSTDQEDRYAGGFLDSAGAFDADFFGMSEDEAVATDPQQRLLLECVWEALERAGVVPASVRGSRTGVYVGMMYSDYGGAVTTAGTASADLIGNAPSMATRRLAYTFGFEGPAMTIDTSCSSGVVGVHLACQALRGDECDMAVAAGVTVMSTPAIFEEFERNGWLAPDGRCRPYADGACGTGFCEGAGVLVLERLADARKLGRPVWAVIRGSAVNQDGATAGIDIPKGPSQQAVIRKALQVSGLGSDDIDIIEGNATGGLMADPIELNALMATYGRRRNSAGPVWLGSVKSNLGHAQAAGGMAGIIKMVGAVRNRRMPRTLHVDRPNTKVDWSSGSVRLLTEPRAWPAPERPRRAAVSSFGISSTNTHVVLEEYLADVVDLPAEAGPTKRHVLPVTVSARDGASLAEAVARLRTAVLASPEWTVHDVGASLARTRSVHGHRTTFLVRSRAELLAELATFPGTDPDEVVAVPGRRARRRTPALVVVGRVPRPARLAVVAGHMALRGLDVARDGARSTDWLGALRAVWVACFGSKVPVHLVAGSEVGQVRSWLCEAIRLGHRSFVVAGTPAAVDKWELVAAAVSGRREQGELKVEHLVMDGADAWRSVLRYLAETELGGVDVRWARLYPARPARMLDLPTYPFQRRRYWPAAAG